MQNEIEIETKTMHEIEMHNQTCEIDSKVLRDVLKGGGYFQPKMLFLILNWLLMVLQCKWQFCLLGSNASTHPNQPNFTEIAYWHVKCAVDGNYSFAIALTDKIMFCECKFSPFLWFYCIRMNVTVHPQN